MFSVTYIAYAFIFLLLSYTLYYQKEIRVKAKKFHSIAKNYKYQTRENWLICYGKSAYLVGKCGLIDFYNSCTAIYTKRFIFVKYIHGGNIYISIIPNKFGPKTNLEYGYIDEIRNDELLSTLAGMHRNFSGYHDALFDFGNTIRYKYEGQDEIILQNPNVLGGSENEKKNDNLKKIKKLVWTS